MLTPDDPQIERSRQAAITELADAFSIDADVIRGWVDLRQRFRTMDPTEFEAFAHQHGMSVRGPDGFYAAS